MTLKRNLLVVLVSLSLVVDNEGSKKISTFVGGSLYPQATESRDLRRLDGVWNFRLSPVGDPEYGFRHKWNSQDLHLTGPVKAMPVPSSYNDVTTDAALRDHVGMAWYDRRFHVPRWWLADGQRVWLRFGSVHYAAQVWVNGQPVMSHEIGHLPFEAEVTAALLAGRSNLLTVAVDNVLLNTTIPQGQIKEDKHPHQEYTFDFFNYAGIHRSVYLYSTPKIYVDDVTLITNIQSQIGVVKYNVTYKGSDGKKVKCQVDVMDHNYTIVGSLSECAGEVHVTNASHWWPYLMNSNPGYLYTLMASVFTENPKILDVYTVKFGFRKITWTNTTMFINNQPLYIRGFSMHEDSDFRGKGWDPVLWTRNFNLLQWVGANAFRTSHYPYAEEIYQMADERGIMIIDECPSGDTDHFSDELLKKHKQSLTELIHRDKNHPSVVIWSIANEARTQYKAADAYFGAIVKHVKSMDMSRPVSMATAQQHDGDKAAKHLDMIMFNRYTGWYRGELQDIKHKVVHEATNWHRTFNKPVFMSEYGAAGLPGIHSLPVSMWSEDYQAAVFSEYFKAFDELRAAGFFAGELIWNFADFQTQQGYTRVDGNKKGIFTRARQPKAAAHLTRARYLALAAADSGAPPPQPAHYVIDKSACHQEAKHMDMIMFNRYNAWYGVTLKDTTVNVVNEATNWHHKFNKPVLMSEYGAEALPGIHSLPESMWSEDYQTSVFSEYFKAFDQLRASGFFAGELIWNFADFQTKQQSTRVDGNKKGIFTRARQPKAAAHLTRARYLALAAADAGAPPPSAARYVSDNKPAYHRELQ